MFIWCNLHHAGKVLMGVVGVVERETESQSKEGYTGCHTTVTLDSTFHNTGDSAQGGFRTDGLAKVFSVGHLLCPL